MIRRCVDRLRDVPGGSSKWRALELVTLAIGIGAVGCGGVTYWESGWRDRDMARISGYEAQRRADALRDRIHRDAMRAHWFGYPGPGPIDTSEGGLARVRLWAPAIHDIADGYARLGDALLEQEDYDGAFAAYDQALTLSKEAMIDRVRAMDVRRRVFEGQAAIWQVRGERERVMAARLLAAGTERWLDSPDAEEARAAYDRLIQASTRARNAIRARAAARNRQQIGMALNQLNTQLQQAQQQYDQQDPQLAQANRNAQQMIQSMQAAVRIAEMTVSIAEGGFEGLALEDIGFVLERFPGLRGAVRNGRIQDFLHSAEGKATLGDLHQTLEKLSSGEPMALVEGARRVAGAAGVTTPFERELRRLDELWTAGRIKSRKYWMSLWELGVPDDLLTELKKLERTKDQGSIDEGRFEIEKRKLIQRILEAAPE